MAAPRKELEAHYHDWTVIGQRFIRVVNFNKTPYVRCRCRCGREYDVAVGALRSGKSRCCVHCANRSNPRTTREAHA